MNFRLLVAFFSCLSNQTMNQMKTRKSPNFPPLQHPQGGNGYKKTAFLIWLIIFKDLIRSQILGVAATYLISQHLLSQLSGTEMLFIGKKANQAAQILNGYMNVKSLCTKLNLKYFVSI
ncbi:MAG: hypothetical protein A2512_07025 [Deltaproteobacteria bacterium RIFOXYD12_FULL_56_24]|nr:MAG: hypothetical protein A2512_07025 [Deltaproteobacteria bacterium RIFOXYD12_FULL_56_24]